MANKILNPDGIDRAAERAAEPETHHAPQGFSDVDSILNYEAREAIVRGYAAKAGFAARVVARQS